MNKHIVVEYTMKNGGNTAESCITLPIEGGYYEILRKGHTAVEDSLDYRLYKETSEAVAQYITDALNAIASLQGYTLIGFNETMYHDDMTWRHEVEYADEYITLL